MSTIVREWKNRAGDVIATIEEGHLCRPHVDPYAEHPHGLCAEYGFTDPDGYVHRHPCPFRVNIYHDAGIVPADGALVDPCRIVDSHFSHSLDEAQQYVRARLPFRNVSAQTPVKQKVAAYDAWRARGALTTKARRRLQARKRRLGKFTPVHYLITDADLRSGYSLVLMRAMYDWRAYGPQSIRFYLDPEWRLDKFAHKNAREAVANFRLLMADGVAPALRKQAIECLKDEDLSVDPLTLNI